MRESERRATHVRLGETHLEEHEIGEHERKDRCAQDGPHGPVDGGEVHEERRAEGRHEDAASRVHRCDESR